MAHAPEAPEAAPLQGFAASGAAEINVVQCYDTNPANAPVPAAGRVVCNAANPLTLPINTPVRNWTIVNLPVGNRLSLPTTFTAMGAGGWQQSFPTCLPADANGECTHPFADDRGGFTARVDFLCNNPQFDIVAGAGPPWGGIITSWPDETLWRPAQFDRIAAAVSLGGAGAITGGDNAYIHEHVGIPTTGVNEWTFQVAEQAIPDYVFTNGTTPVGLAPVKRNVVTYSSPYTGQTGLSAAVTLQGGSPDQPPNDVFTCFDAPLDTVTEMDYLITPNAAVRVPRWTILQSDFDLGDGSVDRILDWQCDVVGTPADGDADGDCDPDTSDIDDGNRDIDGDLVPDGVERAYNSNPNVGDTDGDGCDDYCEIMYFTDPNDTDSDDDGQADKPDAVSTQKVGSSETGDDAPTTGSDALDLTDDNCPGVFNPSQLNTDSMYQFHGMGAGTGDATNPDEDPWGDACDLDDDNDGLPGTTEASLRIKAWTGYSGAQTTVCVGPADTPNFAPDRPMVDTQGDVDRDYVLDGIECQLRSRPDQSIRGTCPGTGCTIALNCSTGSAPVVGGGTLDEGCAQPGVRGHASPNSDPDNDGLYLPGGSQTFHIEKETFFRTRQISTALGVQVDDLDGDGVSAECPSGLMNPDGEGDIDSDRDLRGSMCQTANLRDGLEVQFYGTRPSAVDTDEDGCPDADEVNDLNGDGNSNSGDQGYMVSRILLGNLDANNDGEIDLYVQALNANIDKNSFVSSGDQGLLAAAIVAPGSCQALGAFVEGAFDIGAHTKGLP